MDYRCMTPMGPRHIRMGVTPIVYGSARIAISLADISDLVLSKEKDLNRLQQFARRLISVQEEERQRIAREIHDDLGSSMAMLSLCISHEMKQNPEAGGGGTSRINKVLERVAALAGSLRDLSHRLHPPPLRYLGIVAALRSLQEDFEKAFLIKTHLVVPPQLPRLPEEVEVCIFRVSQECLQNVAKHSGADKVRIVLEHASSQIRLTVSDSGRGFDCSKAMREGGGLGLLSMEERALSIQGRLTVSSSPSAGTEVRLIVPNRER